MERERSKFAGGDQAYLRDQQYRDESQLARRADLHSKYGTARVPWFEWVAEHIDLRPRLDVLEVGCGAGWLWEQVNGALPGGIRLTLTDLSPGMVEHAVSRAAATCRFASVEGLPADLQAMPFGDRSFDRIVANHMLYHLPDPAAGVAELGRMLRSDGRIIVATNGRSHMRELWAIRADVFGTEPVDHTIDVFGAEVGFAELRHRFDHVVWHAYRDQLRCTDQADVMRYVCSTPPAEDADVRQIDRLTEAIERAFRDGGGTMTITKDTGCFVCSSPAA